MPILIILLISLLLLGSAITHEEANTELPWLVSFYYWFQTMTTIGEIPYRVGLYKGWKLLMMIPYNIIFLCGLITVVAMLSLSLKLILGCGGSFFSCCRSTQGDDDDDEEDYGTDDDDDVISECACLLDSADD